MGADPRNSYLRDGLATASPAKLLCMLYDRLVLDLLAAEHAVGASDFATASERLCHAQDIVFELRSSLRLDAWDGAAGLHSLYVYLEERLVAANVKKDATIAAECRAIVEPLRDAWVEAASLAGAARTPLVVGA